jgi:minor extracellular serine protease Vpr
MSGLLRLSVGVLLLASSVAMVPGGVPGGPNEGKLHPYFRQVLVGTGVPSGVSKQGDLFDAIVYTKNPDAVRAAGIHVNSSFPSFVTAQVSTRDLEKLVAVSDVTFIDPGSVNHVQNDVSVPETGASLVQGGLINGTSYQGQGAIVLIYDTGIDWKHKDFRVAGDTTKSRILYIWDQTLTATTGETVPFGFSYGVEYTQAQIDNEIDGTPAGVVREKDVNGHGTHVTGTAAGNGGTFGGQYAGMAPLADIIVVKGADGSFSESRMIDGLTYAMNKATALGKPIVVNWSIGSQGGPHDGTRAYEVAIDAMVAQPGRVVAVSAGNDGDQAIHIGSTIPAAGGALTITFSVPTFTPTSGTENDVFAFDGWLTGNPSISATVTSPTGITLTENFGESGDGPIITDGTITLDNGISSINSQREVWLNVHDAVSTNPPKSGTWTLTLTNPGASSTTFDGWLYAKTVGASTVTLVGGGTDKTVGMPGTSAGAITAASYVTKWGWPSYVGGNYVYTGTDRTGNISSFSANGPTRDGRQKPDIAAPGQGITSSLSTMFDTTGQYSWIQPGQKHWILQGTSMAAPHVTGAAALLLGINPAYTAAQIKTLLQTAANADAFTGTVPNYIWGYGKMDVVDAVSRFFNAGAVITRKTFFYDQVSSNFFVNLAGSQKFAVRITPDIAGLLTGIQINLTTLNNRPIVGPGPLKCEIYTDNAGRPGTLIGSTVNHSHQLLSAGVLNYVQMLGANVPVSAGANYHVVLSMTNPSDTLKVRTDTATVGTRGSLYNGSSWVGVGYNLRLRAIVTSGAGASSVETAEGTPERYELLQNYPNPFNPSTTIGFSIPAQNRVMLKIYNLLGQEVETLINNDYAAGKYRVQWQPVGLATGTYFYRLQAGSYTESKKLLLLK